MEIAVQFVFADKKKRNTVCNLLAANDIIQITILDRGTF